MHSKNGLVCIKKGAAAAYDLKRGLPHMIKKGAASYDFKKAAVVAGYSRTAGLPLTINPHHIPIIIPKIRELICGKN